MIVGERDEHTLILSSLIEVGEEDGCADGLQGHACISQSALLYFPSDHIQVLHHVVSD